MCNKYDSEAAIQNSLIGFMQAVVRVRELHKKVNGPYDNYICDHCYYDEYHFYEYPCPTIKVLNGEQ